MNDETGLERRYRRLLTWYPAQHRHAHGEEMIGVLQPRLRIPSGAGAYRPDGHRGLARDSAQAQADGLAPVN